MPNFERNNGSGDLGSIPGCVIPKNLKMLLDTSLFNTQQYKVRGDLPPSPMNIKVMWCNFKILMTWYFDLSVDHHLNCLDDCLSCLPDWGRMQWAMISRIDFTLTFSVLFFTSTASTLCDPEQLLTKRIKDLYIFPIPPHEDVTQG